MNRIRMRGARTLGAALAVAAVGVPPWGCRFRTRCPLERESAPRSTEEEPPLVDVTGHGHLVACHLVRRGAEAPRLAGAPAELARVGMP
jgi:ABC-type dipeptide/oligopeptide/nickel transport system ATPase component